MAHVFLSVSSIHFISYYEKFKCIKLRHLRSFGNSWTLESNLNFRLYLIIVTKCKDITKPNGEVVCVKH